MIYPFVKEPCDLEGLKDSKAYILHKRLEEVDFKGLNEEELANLNIIFNELWHPETYRHGIYKLMGWEFDFSKWLKTYWVKTKYSGIIEIRSFSKMFIRKNASTPSQILKIIEVN